MKFQMAPNSLFAILLRSPWWYSLAIALVLGTAMAAVMPDGWRIVGALSAFPFAVISAVALGRQWKQPSVEQVEARVRELAAVETDPWVTDPRAFWMLYVGPLAAGAAALADVPRNSDVHPRFDFLGARWVGRGFARRPAGARRLVGAGRYPSAHALASGARGPTRAAWHPSGGHRGCPSTLGGPVSSSFGGR